MGNPFERFLTPPAPSNGRAQVGAFSAENPFARFTQQQENPFSRFLPRDLTNDPLARGLETAGGVVVGVLNKVGWALQPFQGVQQAFVMAPLALATGRPDQALDALKAGVSYYGYGSAEQLPGFQNARANDVKGRTIFKNVGAPDWLADSAGLALDFFGDPTNLLGGAGLAVKTAGTVAKAPRLVTAGQSAIRVADELGAPVRTAVRAIPQPAREWVARNTWKYVFGVDAPIGVIPFLAKTVGRERASIAEAILPPEIARRLAPEDQTKVIDFVGELKRQEQKTLAEYGARAQGLADAFAQATGGLKKPQVDALAAILSRLESAPTRTARRTADRALRSWADASGDPTRYERAMKAYADGIRFDLNGGFDLEGAGKLDRASLLENLAFPGPREIKRFDRATGTTTTHADVREYDPSTGGLTGSVRPAELGRVLPDGTNAPRLNLTAERRGTIRRAFSFFDDPDAWLDKLRAENRPARVSLDPVRLKARLEPSGAAFPVTPVPGSPPPGSTPTSTAAAPGAAASIDGSAPLPLIDLDARGGSVADLRPGARVSWSAHDGRRVRGIISATGEIERAPYTGPKPGRDNLSRADDGESIARGKSALLSRLELEVRKGELDEDVARSAREFARMLPDEYLAGVGTTFRNTNAIDAGAGPGLGFYDPETAIIGIAKLGVNASRIGERTIVHEVAHHLEAFVPLADRRAMRELYEREVRRDGGSATGNAAYRFGNFQEWFAENITDRALRDIYPEGPARSLFERVARVIRDAGVSVYNFFLRGGRRDSAEMVYKNLLAGKYDAGRSGELAPGPLRHLDEGANEPVTLKDKDGNPISAADARRLVSKRVQVQYQAVSDFDYAALDLGNLDAKDVQRLRSAARAVGMTLSIGKVDGRWKASGRGPMTFNHPVVNEYLDADEMMYLAGVKGSDGSASRPVTTIEALETMPVPAWFDPDKGGDALAALEAHRFDLENGAGVGYLTGDEMARVFKDASPEESDAIAEAIERFGMSGPKDDWFPVDTNDPRIAAALARSTDPKAELIRRMAAGKAAKDIALKQAIKATPDVLVSSVQEFFDANPEAPLADGLAHALKTNGITDGRRATAFIRAVLDDTDPGLHRSPSSRETVWKLQERLLEQDAVTVQGGGAPGSLAVGATRVSARQQLSEQILREYGQIEDYRVQYLEQARVVGEVVARKTALEQTKQFMIDEGGMYWPQLAQQINAGRLDPSKLPAALNNLPVDPTGFKIAGGFRTITLADARGLDGVFSAGDVVPDSLYRVITAGKNVQGHALPVMLRVLNNDWKGIKIGNMATAVVNILSAVPMSDHYGVGLGELAHGAFLYATKGKREWLDEMSERGIGNVDGLSNEVRLEAARLREELARAPMTRWDRLNGIVKAYFDFTGESIGTRPGSMPEGPLRTLARFGNPLTGFGLTRGLLNSNQMADNFVRGSVYHARRASGSSPDEAARAAREVLLDYAARPLMVEFGSKSGLDPFATFRYLSAYRVLSTMYDRPTRLARYYRVADSVSDGSDPERRERELKAAQDYVLEKQPSRLTTDSSGRGVYLPFANYFPEGTVTDLIDDPNASNLFGFIPKAPLWAALETVSTGVGFRGMNPYDGLVDKGGFFEAFEKDKVEAVRRAMKVLWRFGASPMAPGTPVMEEIARSIAKTARTTEQLADDAGVSETVMREALKVLEEGPFAWGRQGSLPVAATRGESLTGEPARDLQWSIARALGLKTYDVQGDLTQPGAARNLVRGGSFELQDRKQYLTNLLAKAKRDGMPPAEYERMKAGIIEELNRIAQELEDKANGLR